MDASSSKARPWVEPEASDQTEKHGIDRRVAQRSSPKGNEDVIIASSDSMPTTKVLLEPRDSAWVKWNQTILAKLCLADHQAIVGDIAQP